MSYKSLTAQRAGKIARRNPVDPSMTEEVIVAIGIALCIIIGVMAALSAIGVG